MARHRPYVLSLAGLDPSGGAGLLADIKTMEAHRVYGLGVCTALTFQNDVQFEGLEWIPMHKITQQADLLFDRFTINCAKIGLVENGAVLGKLITYLKNRNPGIQLILDPILRASAGFTFHADTEGPLWQRILEQLTLITPNWNEMQQLVPEQAPLQGAASMSRHCAVLLKGGHHPQAPGRDYLFLGNRQYPFRPKGTRMVAKHGSGCVLSSAIAAHLAKGYALPRACLRAKAYTAKFLSSSPQLLGYHTF